MKRLVQVELTNICNRKCVYCGIPSMTRVKGFADFKVIERVVEVMKLIGQTDPIGLQHYGESTLHPRLVEFIQYFNDNGISPFLYTNGDFLTDHLIERLSTTSLHTLVISGHIEMSKRYELYQKCKSKGINAYWQVTLEGCDQLTSLGGQIIVDHPTANSLPPLKDPAKNCGFLRDQKAIVLWNGDLVPCCFDYDGVGSFGSIFDSNVVDLVATPFKTCSTCPGHTGEWNGS